MRLVEVHGASMAPTLQDGDRVLVVRVGHVMRGDVVVVADPREPARVLVKRVTASEAGRVRLQGDNPAASTDSRVFGDVEAAAVAGRVVYRYFPRERSGWVRGYSAGGGSPARGVRWPGVKFSLEDVDRLLDPAYVEGIGEMSMTTLREKRAECEYIEVALSYLRRMAHGRLDMVAFDIARRKEGRDSDLGDLVDKLPGILASRTHAPGTGRLAALMAPDLDNVSLEELDTIATADRIDQLPSLADDQVETIAERLVALEADLSQRRRDLHELIDRLHQEIVRRYRSGEASIDQILA